jgi:hypothetical protein
VDDSLKLALGVILALAGGLIYLVKRRNGARNGRNGPRAQKAGDMDPAFWQLEQRKLLSEILVPALNRQQETLQSLQQTNKDIHNALTSIRQLVESREQR